MITGLIGMNGSGKTTRLKELSGSRKDCYLPDFPNIPLELSAYELLSRIAKMRKLPNANKRAETLCQTLMIDGAFDHRISIYSAGNYKKTAIATLLLEKQECLFLDEPFETIDAISQEIIFRIFQTMSASGTDITLSTQDLTLSLRFDRIEVFSNLQIVSAGAPKHVLGDAPLSAFSKLSKLSLEPSEVTWLQ